MHDALCQAGRQLVRCAVVVKWVGVVRRQFKCIQMHTTRTQTVYIYSAIVCSCSIYVRRTRVIQLLRKYMRDFEVVLNMILFTYCPFS